MLSDQKQDRYLRPASLSKIFQHLKEMLWLEIIISTKPASTPVYSVPQSVIIVQAHAQKKKT